MQEGVWRAVRFLLLAVSVLGIVATVLPVIPTDTWWIRYLDYPRLQFTLAMLAMLVAVVVLPKMTAISALSAACLVVAICWNVVLLAPYVLPVFAVGPAPEVAAGKCPADRRLRVLTVNVQMGNHHDHRLFEIVRNADPDVAWFQETDAWWENELAPLTQTMPHGISEAQDNYLGVHLFSRLPLENAEIRHLTNSRNPSVFATATLPSGDRVKLYAIHPRPPQVGQSTAERDAQVMATALEANGDGMSHVVMGDLNTVPWEDIAGRLKRIGGLRDPRVGRGLFVTWNANRTLLKWPLDHVMPGPGWSLADLEVMSLFGSDHLPLLAELCLKDGGTTTQQVPADEMERARETVARGQGKAVGSEASKPPGTEGSEER